MKTLTERETLVLDWCALGLPDKQIAGQLGLRLWTVRDRLRRAFRKLGASSRTEAVMRYLNHDLQESVGMRRKRAGLS